MSEFTRASWKAQGQMVGRGKVGTGKKNDNNNNKNRNKNSGRRKVKGKRLPLTFPRLAPVSFRFFLLALATLLVFRVEIGFRVRHDYREKFC